MRLLLEEPIRMRAETRGLDELASSSGWLTKLEWGFTEAKDVCVDFDITVNDKVHEAVLVYPALFPQAPAYVRPRKPDESWSAHQYPSTGTLCLEWGPDNWHSGVTGADLVVSTHKLLAYEKFGPVIGVATPSRHKLTLGQRIRSECLRFLITQQLQAALEASSRTTPIPLAVGTLYRRSEFVAVATQLGDEASPTELGVPKELSDPAAASSWIRKGFVVWCDEWTSLPKVINDQAVLREFLKAKGCWPWPDDEERSGFLLLADAQLRLRPISVAANTDGSAVFDYFPVDCTDKGQVRQPERNATLTRKKVAIVGLGSVGSKIAVSLARSGVTRFLLIDDDILKPSNLTRNQLDWSSMGYDKVDGVQGAIQLIFPAAEVACRTFRFAGQESSSYNTTVLEQIAACDLVIDATANPKVFSSIAAICTRRKVAVVWGEVFAGGIGALMARSLPGFDAEPLGIRSAIHAYLAGMPAAPFQHAQAYDAEEDDEVFVAGDAEVSALSASLTQFAIDALVGADTPRFPNSAYLFGYQKAWIFEAPFDTHPITCPRATEGPEVPVDSEEAVSALRELITTVFGAK
ncbi:ThiF family adenylyltransferase [Paraburkholderia sp. CNPSo 3274]|uniref:ThiF family adenylyltransferase n=1 Tax=Paraburkholderia sp. CNPSo 3274 TaxID=2940932 RepID=UPI0020B810A6|nr:ThiF family adenylyltransferase [Paraburkholderia sp. CNPSo 3274]MCP3710204.1 ThiF family adenylyltransferase [Paraburkholderia sp. CNPSo 3274]